jgi:hypothetical protein
MLMVVPVVVKSYERSVESTKVTVLSRIPLIFMSFMASLSSTLNVYRRGPQLAAAAVTSNAFTA